MRSRRDACGSPRLFRNWYSRHCTNYGSDYVKCSGCDAVIDEGDGTIKHNLPDCKVAEVETRLDDLGVEYVRPANLQPPFDYPDWPHIDKFIHDAGILFAVLNPGVRPIPSFDSHSRATTCLGWYNVLNSDRMARTRRWQGRMS